MTSMPKKQQVKHCFKSRLQSTMNEVNEALHLFEECENSNHEAAGARHEEHEVRRQLLENIQGQLKELSR